jgi:hypothetical protein
MASRRSTPQYNKGEWAELYVLCRILCEKKISVGKYSSTESSRELEVLNISRTDSSLDEFTIDGDDLIIESSKNRVQVAKLCAMAEMFLPEIIMGDWVFMSDTGNNLLEVLEIDHLKTGSEKSDLFLSIRDPLTGTSGRQGYTVKSFLGSPPTLLNAGSPTNFTFSIIPAVPQLETLNLNLLPIRKMCNQLQSKGFALHFVGMHQEFANNLSLVDSRMAEVISHCLVSYYSMECGTDARLSSIVDAIASRNPMSVNNPTVFYRHKLKDFLEAAAYGLTPSRPWTGTRTAPGGLILVEKSGEIVCMPSGSSDDHREFLLQSTKFETPSRSRHGFGKLFDEEGRSILKLNLQIRYS